MPLIYQSVLKRINVKLCVYVFCIVLPLLLSPLAASQHKESRCGYVILLVAAYWLLEPVPVAATALLPVVLFPLLGVVTSQEVCSNYMKEIFMMVIGGLIVAIAVEESKLHERIALKVLLLLGTEIKWLMLSFMLSTMFLSMWVSNLATTAMMVPIVDAVTSQIPRNKDENIELAENVDFLTKEKEDEVAKVKVVSLEKSKNSQTDESSSTMKTILLLSVCYSANIGGTGTLTGTTPNLVFKGFMDELYPGSSDITFASWMIYNVPGMLLCVLVGWLYLWIIYRQFSKKGHVFPSKERIHDIISKRYSGLGSISAHETQVLILFLLLVFLWIFREPKFVRGWVDIIGSDIKIGNSVPAVLIAFLMFLLPANPRDIGGRPILEWKVAQDKLSWGIILLVGGGFALADASQKSGLSHLLGAKLSALNIFSPLALVAIVCFTTAMLTEIMLNTTTANMLLPVLNQMAISIGVNPLYLMLPVSVACSYAFMLPAATGPNAFVFEYGKLKTIDMVKPGIVMNIVCSGIQLLMINTLGVVMFDLNTFPSWANKSELYTSNDVITESLNYTMSFENFTST